MRLNKNIKTFFFFKKKCYFYISFKKIKTNKKKPTKNINQLNAII